MIAQSVWASYSSTGRVATLHNVPHGVPFSVLLPFTFYYPPSQWDQPIAVVGDTVHTLTTQHIENGRLVLRGVSKRGDLRIALHDPRGILAPVSTTQMLWTVQWDMSAPSTPAQALDLTAEVVPVQGISGQWDRSRWGRAVWDAPAPTWAAPHWDGHQWDRSIWPHTTAQREPVSLMQHVTALELRQGLECDGSVCAPAVELLTITARPSLDPHALGLTAGTAIELSQLTGHGAIGLFSGVVDDLVVEPGPDGYTEITCVNTYTAIASLTRHGARSESSDGADSSHAARLNRLGTTEPKYALSVIQNSTPGRPPATVWESSLANHYSAATAAVCATWYPARGGYPARELVPYDHPRRLMPTPDGLAPTDLPAYRRIRTGWRGSDRVGAIEIINHLAVRQPDGWTAADQTTTHSTPRPGRTIQLDVVAPPERVPEIASRYLAAASRLADAPQGVEVVVCHPGMSDNRQRENLDMIQNLSPGQPVEVHDRGDIHRLEVAAWTHRITPTEWITEIDFTALPTPI